MSENTLSPDQCRAARALLGISQEQLCEIAGVTRAPLADFEGGKTKPYARTLGAIKAALEVSGVEFIDENGGGAGVRRKKAVARLKSRHVDGELVTFKLIYKDDTYEFQMAAEILEDWDRANYGSPQEFETSFDKHANAIVVRAQDAIESGRAKGATGVLVIDQDDFPGTG